MLRSYIRVDSITGIGTFHPNAIFFPSRYPPWVRFCSTSTRVQSIVPVIIHLLPGEVLRPTKATLL